jgi:hypothetical protein
VGALIVLAASILIPAPIKPESRISPLMRLLVTVRAPVIVPVLPTLPVKVVLATLTAEVTPVLVCGNGPE